MTNATALIGLALGMRHGTDSDHLTAIDGLSRIRPRSMNGVFFALGHGSIVTLLAAGFGTFLAGRLEFAGPWLLIAIGLVNLVKLLRHSPTQLTSRRPVICQPFLLGMLLAAGFETSSQLSALVIAGRTNPWLLGGLFSLGMVAVDGLDGYLAASTVRLAAAGQTAATTASRWLGVLVVLFSFAIGGAELLGWDLSGVALPLGLGLFAVVIGARMWTRSGWGKPYPRAIDAVMGRRPIYPEQQEVRNVAEITTT